MMRASSPPEATRSMGFSASPTFADMRKRITSMPSAAGSFSVKSTANCTLGISSWRSSVRMRCSSSFAAALRASESCLPASLTFASCFFSSLCSRTRVSSANSMRSSSSRQRSRYASISSTLPPYFFFKRYSRSQRSSTLSSSSGENSYSLRRSRRFSATSAASQQSSCRRFASSSKEPP